MWWVMRLLTFDRSNNYVMVEADSHLKLLPLSILDIYKVFEHIDMLSIGIWKQPYTVKHPAGSDFGVLGRIWSRNIVIISWLRLTATSNCFLHLYWTYTKCLSTLICCLLALAYGTINTHLFTLRGSDFWGSGSSVESEWCHYVMVEADSHLKLLPLSN
jgi:hypothetical protein